MRQGLVHTFAWSLATGAATTLSWWGVHTVMSGTAYDPPRAVPIAAATTAAPSSPPPLVAATQRPESSTPRTSASMSPHHPTPVASTTHASPSATKPHASSSPTKSAPKSSGSPSSTVKSYEIAGGRAVFSVGTDAASLVSATPNTGWQMQVWTETDWIRVTFTRDDQESSVFYTWNGHPPIVQFYDS